MKIRGTCNACRSTKWFVRQRSYVFKKVSDKPIHSQGELCGTCFRNIKRLTLDQNGKDA